MVSKAKNKVFDLNVFGEEPVYNPDVVYDTGQMIGFYNWYNYMFDGNDVRKFTKQYCKENKDLNKYMKAVDNVAADQLSTTAGWLSRMSSTGMKITVSQKAFIKERLEHYVSETKYVRHETTDDAPVVSVAERTAEKAKEYAGEVEGMIDDFIVNDYQSPYDLYAKMTEIGIKGAHVRHIAGRFKPYIKELTAAIKNHKKKDDPVAEGYQSTKLSELKRLVKFVESITDALQTIEGNAKKSRKTRTRKAKPAKKQVSKMKYMERFDPLKLVSVSPEKLVGAKAALIFNTANNQLSLYVAEADGFVVARSSIKNFRVKESQMKRFGKKTDLLQSFDKMTRVEAIKAFGKVKGSSNDASGRVNEKMIILKVY